MSWYVRLTPLEDQESINESALEREYTWGPFSTEDDAYKADQVFVDNEQLGMDIHSEVYEVVESLNEYSASVSLVIDVEASSLQEAEDKIMSIIHSKPFSDYGAEMSDFDTTHPIGVEASVPDYPVMPGSVIEK